MKTLHTVRTTKSHIQNSSQFIHFLVATNVQLLSVCSTNNYSVFVCAKCVTEKGQIKEKQNTTQKNLSSNVNSVMMAKFSCCRGDYVTTWLLFILHSACIDISLANRLKMATATQKPVSLATRFTKIKLVQY